MDGTQQQRENRTNTLSEEHVQSAIETVLTNRMQSYEEFMNAFMVLTPDDVNRFSARGSSEGVEGQKVTSDSLDETLHLIQSSSASPSGTSGQPKTDLKQLEELEIEELGEDFINEAESVGSENKRKSSKYIQVDNFLDEPDSESESLSDESDIDFDDSSSKYVASFDMETDSKREAANNRVPPAVTSEMMEKVIGKERDIETSSEGTSPCLPDIFPGEVENQEDISSSPCHGVHVTQLPGSTAATHQPQELDTKHTSLAEESEDDVQPFSIDPDFDYDNVILTPKWEPGHGPPSGI